VDYDFSVCFSLENVEYTREIKTAEFQGVYRDNIEGKEQFSERPRKILAPSVKSPHSPIP
jgi:hypothetical protein